MLTLTATFLGGQVPNVCENNIIKESLRTWILTEKWSGVSKDKELNNVTFE